MKHHKPKRAAVISHTRVLVVGAILLFSLIFFYFGFRRSLFVTTKERVHIVVYGSHPVVYSVDTRGDIHYAIQYPPDLSLNVPGGYGNYRVGALGKLVSLEKDPHILQRSFSAATSIFVDYYFYESADAVYYGNSIPNALSFPTVKDFFQMNSNANMFDKLYLAMLFGNESKRSFKLLEMRDSEQFLKKYRGYFYSIQYRNEKKNVQIQYTDSYTNAEAMSHILEGNGIRVSDISKAESPVEGCEIGESGSQFSQSAHDLSSFFGCRLKERPTNLYDIIFVLGDREKDWEVQ